MLDIPPLRLYEYSKSYIPIILLLITLGSILGFPHFSFPSILCQVLFLQVYIYGGHALLHQINEEDPFYIFNPHIFIHHNKHIHFDRWIELAIEGCSNFSYIIFPIILQNLFNIQIFSTSIVISGALLYVIMHIFQYSILGDTNHALHHMHKLCNYEPEFMDVLFHTRCEPDSPYKDLNQDLPNVMLAFLLSLSLKRIFDLD